MRKRKEVDAIIVSMVMMEYPVVVLHIVSKKVVCKVIELNKAFVLRKICHVYLLVPIKSNKISNDVMLLNESSAAIFQECSNAIDVHSLAILVAKKFIDVDVDEVVPEIESYVLELIDSGLLVESISDSCASKYVRSH